MPEAIAEGTNVRGVISQLAHLDHKHFLIPQGKAEGLIFLRNRFIVHVNGLSWANGAYYMFKWLIITLIKKMEPSHWLRAMV